MPRSYKESHMQSIAHKGDPGLIDRFRKKIEKIFRTKFKEQTSEQRNGTM